MPAFIFCTPPRLLHFGQGWQYSAAALRAELDALDLANMDIVDVAKVVKDVRSKHGTTLASIARPGKDLCPMGSRAVSCRTF